MKAKYLRDHCVLPYEAWTGKQSIDWLHPSHGPLPHKLGAILCGEDEYTVALWLLDNRIVTITELVDTVDVNKGWGNRRNKKGWVINSLNWIPSGRCFRCYSYYVIVPKQLDHKKEETFLQEIMTASVEITIDTPLGDPIARIQLETKG